jgi:hypothetical protein
MNLPGSGRASDPVVPGAESEDPKRIREEIEHTRADMSQTIDEIQERLNPDRLKEQAKHAVHDATIGRARNAMNAAGEALGQAAEQAQETAGAMVDATIGTARNVAHAAGDAVGQAAQQAQETAGTVADRVRENSVPLSLIGAGIAWWLIRGTGRGTNGRDRISSREGATGSTAYAGTTAYATPGGYGVATAGRRRMQERSIATYPGTPARAGWTDVLRDHPIPATLAAVSIGYLLVNRGGSRPRGYSARADRPRRLFPHEDRSTMSRFAGEAGGAVRDAAQRARDSAGELAEQAGDSIRRAGEQVRETAGDLTEHVQEGWETVRDRTTSELDRWLDDNPLALGAAALAAGAIIGLLAPRSEVEDEYLGEARDSLVDAAERAAHQAGETVQTAAQQVMGSEKAGDRPSGGLF